MKKLFLLAFAAAFTACSDDGGTPVNENEMTLHKTEKFSPSLAAYTSGTTGSLKRVQYFEGNLVVADSTFDAQGNLFGMVEHTYTENTYIRHYTGSNQAERATKFIFDSEGRITHALDILQFPTAQNVAPTFVYNADQSISEQYVDVEAGTSNLFQTFYTNSDGFITNSTYSYTGATTSYSYNGNNVSAYTNSDGANGPETINYTYYSTPVPANMQRSAIEINNAYFMYEANPSDMTNSLVYYGNAYLQSYQGYLTFEKDFNAQGYITYDKVIGTMYQLVHDSETFYYYNE